MGRKQAGVTRLITYEPTTRRPHLIPPLCWETLTRDYIEQFRSWLITERGLSNTTTNKQIKTMSTFLMWANGAGKVTAPMKLGKLKEQTDGGKMYLSTEDIDALCDLELTGAERDTRDWFIISVAQGYE